MLDSEHKVVMSVEEVKDARWGFECAHGGVSRTSVRIHSGMRAWQSACEKVKKL